MSHHGHNDTLEFAQRHLLYVLVAARPPGLLSLVWTSTPWLNTALTHGLAAPSRSQVGDAETESPAQAAVLKGAHLFPLPCTPKGELQLCLPAR